MAIASPRTLRASQFSALVFKKSVDRCNTRAESNFGSRAKQGGPSKSAGRDSCRMAAFLSLERLRSIVSDSLGKHMYSNAAFFADKLVAMSHGAPLRHARACARTVAAHASCLRLLRVRPAAHPPLPTGDPDDVYRLAQAYYYTKQHRRALHLLRAHGLAASSVRACYLAARCLLEARSYDECLQLVARGVALAESDPHACASPGTSHGSDGRVSSLAALYLLAGKCHDAQEHRSLAAKAYAQAACQDVFCFEAVDALVGRRMLSQEQQHGLLAQVQILYVADRDSSWRLTILEVVLV
ncbi:hypothetical protein T492DRAFT_904889 [Pavlovales sp. CCMP2436]|nr:hypothetical protein T492DRAFT_904889 [Pavlovales sp. CCMP2436]